MQTIKSTISISIVFTLVLWGCSKQDEISIDEELGTTTIQTEEVVISTEETNIENKPLIVVSQEDSLKILVRADGAPGMWLGEDGEVHGFYVDLEKKVMDKMGQNYLFVPYNDLGYAVQSIKTGTCHTALAVTDVPDYRTILNMSIPYEIIHYVTFLQSDDNSIAEGSNSDIITSFHGKKVGVQTLGHVYQILRDIKEIELIEFPTTTKAMEALNNGLVDIVPENRETGLYYSELNDWDLKIVGGSILNFKNTTGFSKRYDPSIIDSYNEALQSLIDDGTVVDIWESYYGPMPAANRPF